MDEEDLRKIILGATVYGGGGGGSFGRGLELIKDIGKVSLQESPKPDEYYVSHFAIGSLSTSIKEDGDAGIINRIYRTMFRNFDGIIGGEIGPLVLALNFRFAEKINKPILDTDAGGGRAIPTMLSDLYTALNLERLPIVATSTRGNILIIQNAKPEELDPMIDSFFEQENSPITIIGYGISGSRMSSFPFGTISRCMTAGEDLTNGRIPRGFRSLGTFKVEEIHITEGRFTKVIIRGGGYELGAVNEFAYVKKGNRVIARMPEIISLIDWDVKRGLLSNEAKEGKEVEIVVGIPSPPMMKKEFSEKYLSPEAFGFSDLSS